MSVLNKGLTLVQQYCLFANSVVEKFINDVNGEPLVPAIMHYTNDLGLAGILETQTLRFTNVFDVNDPSEIKHGFSHAIRILNELSINQPPLVKQFAKRFETIYKNHLDRTAHYFICSFSKVTDDLGQWRSYADDGRGYALVFNGDVLEDYFVHHAPNAKSHHSTFSIHYDDEEITQICNALVSGMFELISFPLQNALSDNDLHVYLSTLSKELSARLIHIALFFKHEAYIHESEFRFLQVYRGDIPAPDLKLRPRKYQMVEYKEFDWSSIKTTALKKIIVGPAANFKKSADFAKYYLGKAGMENVEIEHSKIPYRSF